MSDYLSGDFKVCGVQMHWRIEHDVIFVEEAHGNDYRTLAVMPVAALAAALQPGCGGVTAAEAWAGSYPLAEALPPPTAPTAGPHTAESYEAGYGAGRQDAFTQAGLLARRRGATFVYNGERADEADCIADIIKAASEI